MWMGVGNWIILMLNLYLILNLLIGILELRVLKDLNPDLREFFFVELNSGGVVVVKGPKSVAEEFFTNLLALKMGICVPSLRVICRDGSEGMKLVNSILQTDKLGASIYGLQGVHHFLLKEYILAKNLDKMDYTEMQDIFGIETELGENSKKRIKEIARILALDVLTNYGDRLPFIWPNQGNSGNLMLSQSGQFICIENGFNALSTSLQIEKYKTTVENLLKKLVTNPEKLIPEFSNINQKIYSFTDYSFQDQGIIQLQKSFLEFLKWTTQVEILEDMIHWKNLLRKFSSPLLGIDAINEQFINDIWKLFQKYGK